MIGLLERSLDPVIPDDNPMTKCIVSLGLPDDLYKELPAAITTPVYKARDVADLRRLMSDHDVYTIVIDGRSIPEAEATVRDILGLTTLTTRILLIHSQDECELEHLCTLGIVPVSPSNLVQQLSRP